MGANIVAEHKEFRPQHHALWDLPHIYGFLHRCLVCFFWVLGSLIGEEEICSLAKIQFPINSDILGSGTRKKHCQLVPVGGDCTQY